MKLNPQDLEKIADLTLCPNRSDNHDRVITGLFEGQ